MPKWQHLISIYKWYHTTGGRGDETLGMKVQVKQEYEGGGGGEGFKSTLLRLWIFPKTVDTVSVLSSLRQVFSCCCLTGLPPNFKSTHVLRMENGWRYWMHYHQWFTTRPGKSFFYMLFDLTDVCPLITKQYIQVVQQIQYMFYNF
jgi:hypothetical protein